MQCSFEIDLHSKVVMLYDRSNSQTTQVGGENATPFQHGRLRRVVVHENLNTIFGMGGTNCDLVEFMIIWHQQSNDTLGKIMTQESLHYEVTENPRLARTLDEGANRLTFY